MTPWIFRFQKTLSLLLKAYKRSPDATDVANTLDEESHTNHDGYIPTDDYDQYKNDIDYFLPAFF